MTPPRDPWAWANPAELSSRFGRAGERERGIREHRLAVGGHDVLLRFAGDALPPVILPALGHLPRAGGGDPALTINLWTEDLPLPAPSSGAAGRTEGGMHFLRGDGFLAAFQPEEGILSALDLPSSAAFFLVTNPARLPAWVSASPLHDILHWWMSGHGLSLVHAAAVGDDRGGVLLAGRGGAGKSTCALACLGSGLRVAAEDYCLVSGGPRPFVHSLYCAAKVDEGSAAMLPHLAGDVASARLFEGPKAVLFLNPGWAGSLSPGFPLKALVVPRVTGAGEPSLAPESPARALAALAPSTIFQFPGGGDETFRRLAGLARALPCHRLSVGRDISRLPAILTSLLEESRS